MKTVTASTAPRLTPYCCSWFRFLKQSYISFFTNRWIHKDNWILFGWSSVNDSCKQYPWDGEYASNEDHDVVDHLNLFQINKSRFFICEDWFFCFMFSMFALFIASQWCGCGFAFNRSMLWLLVFNQSIYVMLGATIWICHFKYIGNAE